MIWVQKIKKNRFECFKASFGFLYGFLKGLVRFLFYSSRAPTNHARLGVFIAVFMSRTYLYLYIGSLKFHKNYLPKSARASSARAKRALSVISLPVREKCDYNCGYGI